MATTTIETGIDPALYGHTKTLIRSAGQLLLNYPEMFLPDLAPGLRRVFHDLACRPNA
jgi:hypothetical protein